MYPVSNDYLEKIQSGSVRTGWSGTIVTTGGQAYDFTEDDLSQGQSKIVRSISSGDNIEIGTTCAAELSMAIYLDVERYTLYGATVELFFTLYYDDGGSETIPCGIFTITEPPTRYLGISTIHAYDNMAKFDANFGLITSGAPYDILLMACVDCGVELGMTEEEIQLLPNGTRETFIYQNATVETYRELVGYVASYLGGYATIGVDGKLYIREYGMTSVRTISADWRYEYRPSEYESFYSGISAINMENNATEILSNEGEDGLLYEMGENPLIQFTESTDRRAALDQILDALSAFLYTPFSASTPSDPSLDVGDVVEFSDGVAVTGKKSALTSITININGSMELECVGGDPHTSDIKTKTDKALSEMRANTSAAELVTYGYTNAKEVVAENRKMIPVLQLLFATASKTPKIDIWMEILLDTVTINADGLVDLLDPMSVTVTYALNGTELDYSPVETYAVDGGHILGLHYFIPEVDPDTRYTWTVYLTMYNGSARMGVDCIHAFLSGQGLVSDSDLTGLGIIDVSDEVYSMNFHNAFNVIKATEVLGTDLGPVDQDKSIAETFTKRIIHGTLGKTTITPSLGDGITYLKAADFITVADVLEMTVNRDYVETASVFRLHTAYETASEALAVDSGALCVVTAVTEGLRSITSIEVEDD